MGVDVSDAPPEQRMTVNVGERLRIRRNRGDRQAREGGQHLLASAQGAERDLPDDKGMREHCPALSSAASTESAERRWSTHIDMSTRITRPSAGAWAAP